MRVGIVGCGVVGAAIAFELSQTYEVIVWDLRRSPTGLQAEPGLRQRPSHHQWQATGAALGVLMAALNFKLKSKHLQVCLDSLKLYETLIPQLEAILGSALPYNRQGILQLCFDAEELQRWRKTQQVRAQQGFQLDILQWDQVFRDYPQLQSAHLVNSDQTVVGAIYSPQDRQIDPVVLTQALIAAAQINGAEIQYEAPVEDFKGIFSRDRQHITHVRTERDDFPIDRLIISAGLGSMPLTTTLKQTVPIYPVLGQAMHLRRRVPIADPSPVINGGKMHLVPLNTTDVWIGATVEFPTEIGASIDPDPAHLQALHHQAIALDASLADAKILRTWSGLRPRPHERAAPIIESLPGYDNVVVASGHYRNGVLLAPITAQKVRQLLSNFA